MSYPGVYTSDGDPNAADVDETIDPTAGSESPGGRGTKGRAATIS